MPSGSWQDRMRGRGLRRIPRNRPPGNNAQTCAPTFRSGPVISYPTGDTSSRTLQPVGQRAPGRRITYLRAATRQAGSRSIGNLNFTTDPDPRLRASRVRHQRRPLAPARLLISSGLHLIVSCPPHSGHLHILHPCRASPCPKADPAGLVSGFQETVAFDLRL